ncbi:two-component regulator propeller domain-containing protein [Candidatus Marithioploca araucensis]|uniref:Two-component regulator propeller domain-containing protein n=1 Tax=Candidatus Marithioploca araucensis TaxID=70273 RepID=A0ABT7VQ25_9GAMM|nr:two-component regulator propeller domain-containing protein [Candidatus Marithioploca araucensis]
MNIQYVITNSLFALFFLLISSLSVVQAADLVFTPATPTVEIGQQLTLSVSGTSGEITWSALKGQIQVQGVGNQVTYIAPAQAGTDVVTVLDEVGNAGTIDNVGVLKFTVTPKQLVSLENATWEVFTNRSLIQALAMSDDGKTLWVGTYGGLEERDATTGQLKKVFTNLDGLPQNHVHHLESDGHGGVWVKTMGSIGENTAGLVHRSVSGEWTVYNEENSDLPSNVDVWTIENDGSGGIWIGYGNGGGVYHSIGGEWTVYNQDNSGLPSNSVSALESDNSGGLWIGTYRSGLAYRSVSGEWTVYTTDNSGLPNNTIYVLESDGNGGLWIATSDDGLAYRNISGEWTVYKEWRAEYFNYNISAFASDNNGGLWIGTSGLGIVHHSVSGKWTIYNEENSDLPDKWVYALESDGNSGLWIGTNDGFAYRSVSGEWTIYNEKNLGPDNWIYAIENDNSGGLLWLATEEGIASRNVNGEWKVYNEENTGLQFSRGNIYDLESDGNGGLWISTGPWTDDDSLAYLSVSGEWTVYNQDNSELPRGYTLESDDRGGLWIGNDDGLAYLSVSGEWTVYTTDNSELPNKYINALESDNRGGLWIGTGDGLAYLSVSGEWTVYTTDNSELPNNGVYALESDGSDGLWIFRNSDSFAYRSVSGKWTIYNEENSGLLGETKALKSDGNGGLWFGGYYGVIHRSVSGELTVYNENNSGLPGNQIYALESDGSTGLWIGTLYTGLAHLTFGEKDQVCTQINSETCEALLTGKRAAIIIAGGGAQSENTLWDTTEAISNRIYKVFYNRGFDKSELYYLSPKSWADFNGDGFNDFITRTPEEERALTVDDVRAALEWAKTGGKLDQPLYLFFIDHGGPDKLQLAENTQMEANEFKAILDDYQNSTGNKLVLVIEACYSGSLVKALAAPNRAIISSAKENELAYFVEKQGFSHFFADNIWKGMNLFEAFNSALLKQDKLRGKLVQQLSGAANSTINTSQTPQLDDNADGTFTADDGQWLKEVYVNGNFVTGDFTLAVESLTTLTGLSVDQAIILKAKASTAVGRVVRVWAIVRPPKINLVLDSNGTPILAFPRFNLSSTEEENVWQTTWNDAVYNGDYEISFYAEDNDGNIASSDNSVIISVTGGVEPPEQANLQIVLEKARYRPGELLKAELIENLGWGYDLYAAVVMPDGHFIAFKNTNQFSPVNEAKKWLGQRIQNSHTTLVDFTLPEGLPTGEYCLYGILSPERENVVETLALDLWVWEQRCFEVY